MTSTPVTAVYDRTNLDKWLDALENGAYPQTSGYLHDDRGFCCIGVACEVAGIPSEYYDDNDGEHPRWFFGDDDADDAIAPLALLNWLRFDPTKFEGVGEIAPATPDYHRSLASLNDHLDEHTGEHVNDFRAIAQVIRENYWRWLPDGVKP